MSKDFKAVSGRSDRLICKSSNHKVLHDNLQIIIAHPLSCSERGCYLDVYKTFHPVDLALKQLEECGVELTTEQEREVKRIGEECRKAKR